MRTTSGLATHRRRKRLLKAAKGFRGTRSKLYKSAKQTLIKAGQYAYRDRRVKKREFRALWITRINAACSSRGISYSFFIAGLKHASVALNRKMLSEVAIYDAEGFDKIVELAKASAPSAAA